MNQKHYQLSLVLMVFLFAFGGYRYYALATRLTSREAEFASTTATFQAKVIELEGQLAKAADENNRLNTDLQTETNRNNSFANQIENLSNTVGTLKKLSETDKELLQKYSKIYFLNEHYTPEHLTTIPAEYVVTTEKEQQIHSEVWPNLEDMLKDAAHDNATIQIVSGYRSFGTQATLKANYRFTYGAGTANQFSADQGYSEHQLGTAVDLTTPSIGVSLSGFDKTPAYAWLKNNAYRYGFTLSYPENNTYYQFEPWHWRFVGKRLSRTLHRQNKSFYDLDQREIDTYLVQIFD